MPYARSHTTAFYSPGPDKPQHLYEGCYARAGLHVSETGPLLGETAPALIDSLVLSEGRPPGERFVCDVVGKLREGRCSNAHITERGLIQYSNRDISIISTGREENMSVATSDDETIRRLSPCNERLVLGIFNGGRQKQPIRCGTPSPVPELAKSCHCTSHTSIIQNYKSDPSIWLGAGFRPNWNCFRQTHMAHALDGIPLFHLPRATFRFQMASNANPVKFADATVPNGRLSLGVAFLWEDTTCKSWSPNVSLD